MKKFKVKVVPRASRNEVVGMHGDCLKVKLCAPPVDGAANAALREVLAEHFHVKPSAIHILSGETARIKLIGVE